MSGSTTQPSVASIPRRLVLVTMQRLHEKDLSGILIERGWRSWCCRPPTGFGPTSSAKMRPTRGGRAIVAARAGSLAAPREKRKWQRHGPPSTSKTRPQPRAMSSRLPGWLAMIFHPPSAGFEGWCSLRPGQQAQGSQRLHRDHLRLRHQADPSAAWRAAIGLCSRCAIASDW
jgi:hypothetical protein